MSEKLNNVLAKVNKDYGQGTIRFMTEENKIAYDVIPSGILEIDNATGIGGFPKSRIVEFFGEESTSKTMLFGYIMAECQKNGGKCIYVDLEHSVDIDFLKSVTGLNPDELIVMQPDLAAEDIFQIIEDIIDTKEISMIVVDSVSALICRAELEGDYGNSNMGLTARLMSQAMRKLTAKLQKSNCLLGFVNQQRDKIGGYGSPKVTSGGHALKFYASMRIEMKKAKIEVAEERIGDEVTLKFVKNKCGLPYKTVTLPNIYGKGFSKEMSLLRQAVKSEVVKKAGSWYSIGEQKLGQGEMNIVEQLEKDRDLYNKILGQSLTTKVVGLKSDFQE